MTIVLSVALQNHPGSLAEVLEILSRAEINIEALEAEAQGDFGTVRLLVNKPNFAADLLRQDGYDVIEAEGLLLSLPDRHGELARIARQLAEKNINVVSLFGTSSSTPGETRLLLRVNNPEAARAVLDAKVAKYAQ